MTYFNDRSEALFAKMKPHWTKRMTIETPKMTYAELETKSDADLDAIKKTLLDELHEVDRKRREKIYSILSFQRELARLSEERDAQRAADQPQQGE